jgi:hypothetical protein
MNEIITFQVIREKDTKLLDCTFLEEDGTLFLRCLDESPNHREITDLKEMMIYRVITKTKNDYYKLADKNQQLKILEKLGGWLI